MNFNTTNSRADRLSCGKFIRSIYIYYSKLVIEMYYSWDLVMMKGIW